MAVDSTARNCAQCGRPLTARVPGMSGRPSVHCSDVCRSAFKKAYANRYFRLHADKWKTSAERYAANPDQVRACKAKWRAENLEKARASARKSSLKCKDRRQAWLKAKRDENPDYTREIHRRWKSRNLKKEQARQRQWNLDHIAQAREHSRLFQFNLRRSQPELVRERSRRSYAKHAEKYRERARQFAKTPKGRAAGHVYQDMRRARMAGVPSEPIDRQKVYTRDGYICARCHEFVEPSQRSLDHRIPISKGGAHTYDNVQLMHRVCNSRKRARLPEDDELLMSRRSA